MSFQKDSKTKHPIAVPVVPDDEEIQHLTEKCYNELIEISKAIAAERHMHYTNIINVEALRQMSREMPMTEEDMLAIPHITHAVYEKYGKRFLEVTEKYAAERCVIDAEKADKEMLSVFAENADNWSDAEPPNQKTTSKRGVKRKYTKGSASFPTKKQKAFFSKKKWQKSKMKSTNSSQQKNKWNKKKTNPKLEQVPSKVPGFLPVPKPGGKVASRSFLPAPRITLI